MENDEMTNDAAVADLLANMKPAAFYVRTSDSSEHYVAAVTLEEHQQIAGAYATTVAELQSSLDALRGEVELRKSAQAALSQYASAAEQRADAAERGVAELEAQFDSVLECLSHFASVAAKDGDTFADTAINGITELTNTIEKEEARGLAVREAAQSIDDSWDALMDTQPVIPVSINKLRELRATLTKESP